jgi:hypothetical protein
MFKLIAKNHVKHWPAKAQFATNDGVVQAVNFYLDLVLIPTNEFNALARLGDDALLQQVITGWDDIGDEDGNPLEFNQENLIAASRNGAFARAALSAYVQASSGQAAEKNLSTQ